MEPVCFTNLKRDHIYQIVVNDRQQIQCSGIFYKYKKGNAIFTPFYISNADFYIV